MMKTSKIIILLIIVSQIPFLSFSQMTKVRGKIIDSSTKEAIPFANIVFKGTSIGTVTGFDGEYFIETREKVDTIVFSFMGYKKVQKAVNKGQFNELNIELLPDANLLDEVVVNPGRNPAHIILDGIKANKKRNNPNKFDAYQYEIYNKIEIDVNNIDDDFKNKKIFKHFKFIFDYMDTSVVTGKSYLPVFIAESMSNYYYSKQKGEKEIIEASKISGVENESISQFMGSMYQKINIYDNYINMFDKKFVSPIANFSLLYYRLYLIDSVKQDGKKFYQISFKPKRKQELTFTGDFWVQDEIFAIKSIKIRIAEDANINFVEDFVIENEYTEVNDTTWMLKKEKIFADFTLSDKQVGFFGRKTTHYDKFIINKPKEADFYSSLGKKKVEFEENASDRNNDYWQENRTEILSKKEEQIYNMIDSIQEVPVFKTYIDIITLIVTGHKEFGWFEFGPYSQVYSFNGVEGHRFRLGGRTNTKLFENLFFDGFLAYGIKDEKFKYGIGSDIFITRDPFRKVRIEYKNDLIQLGESPNALTNDNIFASALRRNPNEKLSKLISTELSYYNEWFPGLSNKLSFKYRAMSPPSGIDFNFKEDEGVLPIIDNKIETSEFILNMRFAPQEQFIVGARNRVSLGTKYPIIQVQYTRGVSNIFASDYNYNKLVFNITHKIKITPFGHIRYKLEAGKIFDKLPYPLLEMHKGNETFFYDDKSFNLMNYFEFLSDEYLSAFITYHLDGYFLNKLPLFRKLKLREVVSFRSVIGQLSDDNFEYNNFSSDNNRMELTDDLKITELSKPYVEVGLGIENILKIFRVDGVWRLSYLDHENINPFGIRATLQIAF